MLEHLLQNTKPEDLPDVQRWLKRIGMTLLFVGAFGAFWFGWNLLAAPFAALGIVGAAYTSLSYQVRNYLREQ